MKPLLFTACCVLAVSRADAAPKMLTIPVGSSYKNYAAASNTASFEAATQAAGLPMQIITTGPKREREIAKGYATLFATWAQTTLRVPLGWSAFDAKNDIERSIVLSPGKTVRIVARSILTEETSQRRDAFEQFKQKAVAQTRARLQAEKLQPGTLELLDAPNGAFVVRALNVRNAGGKAFSFIEHFAQRATLEERDAWWAKRARNEPLSTLPLPMALSLLAPAQQFDKYLGLFGLMLRDRGLNWAREETLTPEEFAARTPEASAVLQTADEAVALLRAGSVEEFLARFPEALSGQTRAQSEARLRQITIPFLQKFPAPTRTQITLVTDSDPQEPLFRVTMLRTAIIGETSPAYVVALEREKGQLHLLGIATTDDPDAL